MAVGPDRVQVLKQESTAQGGDDTDTTDYPAPINPQEDALEAAGFYIQDGSNRDEQVWIERAGNDMKFFDVSNPSGKTLTQLAAGGSGLTTGTATINFGSFPGSSMASVAVTGQTSILTTSKVDVGVEVQTATADHSVDEHIVDKMYLVAGNIVAGVGFTIYAESEIGLLYGTYNIRWFWV